MEDRNPIQRIESSMFLSIVCILSSRNPIQRIERYMLIMSAFLGTYIRIQYKELKVLINFKVF